MLCPHHRAAGSVSASDSYSNCGHWWLQSHPLAANGNGHLRVIETLKDSDLLKRVSLNGSALDGACWRVLTSLQMFQTL